MSTLRETLTEKLASFIQPIPGDKPAGTDASFDPDFEKVKAEIDKMSALSGGEPNWRDVTELCTKILGTKSKDLRLASWLVSAKLRREGWQGYAEGLIIFHGLCRDFWPTMYPDAKRARARVNAIAWMFEQAEQLLRPSEINASNGPSVKVADEVLWEIDEILTEKLGDAYQGPGMMRSLMREKLRDVPDDSPPPAADAAPQDASAPASTARADSPPASTAAQSYSGSAYNAPPASLPSSAEDVERAVWDNCQAIMEAAKILRRAEPTNPWAYQLHRAALWMTLTNTPPAEDGKTRLRPPDDDLLAKIKRFKDSQKWLEVVNICEEESRNALFALDFHRETAAALERQGGLFVAAAEAVGRETYRIVEKFPALTTLCYNDGTPFASDATRGWLDDMAKKFGGGGGGGSSKASEEDEAVLARLEEAKQLVAKGEIAQGLSLGLALAQRSADARARFRSHLSVARMAIEGERHDIARPMLEDLVTLIDRHVLDAWEPDLSATVYSSLLTCIRVLGKSKPTSDQASKEQFLFDKLCRLDPALALRLSG